VGSFTTDSPLVGCFLSNGIIIGDDDDDDDLIDG
jgi:hypothetical protein